MTTVNTAGPLKLNGGGGGGSGTVTSINVSGGLSGLVFTGGPVETSGVITITEGLLSPAFGGTGVGPLSENSVIFVGASGAYAQANTNFNYNPSGGLTLRGVGTAVAAIQAMASGNTASNMAAYFASANEANLWIYRGDGINQLFGTYGMEHGSASGSINFNISSSRTVMFNEGGPGSTNIVTIAKEGVDIAGGWIKTQAPTGHTAVEWNLGNEDTDVTVTGIELNKVVWIQTPAGVVPLSVATLA